MWSERSLIQSSIDCVFFGRRRMKKRSFLFCDIETTFCNQIRDRKDLTRSIGSASFCSSQLTNIQHIMFVEFLNFNQFWNVLQRRSPTAENFVAMFVDFDDCPRVFKDSQENAGRRYNWSTFWEKLSENPNFDFSDDEKKWFARQASCSGLSRCKNLTRRPELTAGWRAVGENQTSGGCKKPKTMKIKCLSQL